MSDSSSAAVRKRYSKQVVVVYLGDILIFSPSEEEHVGHVRRVLARLREANLYAKLEKCTFGSKEVEFLGYLVSHKGLRLDPSKVETIVDWQTSIDVTAVQTFLEFANFYRKFIQAFSEIVLPLTNLTRVGAPFVRDS